MGGGGGSLKSTNAITPAEASVDYSNAAGQAQQGGIWAAPNTQANFVGGGGTLAPVSQYIQGAGVQTGIPQGGMMEIPGYGETYIPGGYAAPGIASYFAGPQGGGSNLSYQAGQHDAWLGDVVTDAEAQAQDFARSGAGEYVPGVGAQQAEGSHLNQDYYDAQVQTIRDETGWADYDPTTDVFAGSEYEEAYRNSDAAQEAADTIYSNQIGVGAGNSLETGQYGGVGIGDQLHSGVEHIGEFSPIVGGIIDPIVDNARNAPANEHRSDDGGARSAFEIAIDREDKAYADSVASGAVKPFDMNDPSTWSNPSDRDNDSGGDDGGNDKIVCTAMNNDYGFGTYRNAIWLRYSKDHMTKAHEVGYHTIFRPLLAMRKKHWFGKKVVYPVLQHIARHRTADLRAEMQGKKRDTIGRIERFFLEPVCYIVGRAKLWIQG